ncbi:MAG TPA: TonB-dependent receptor [Thermoanaerobaculia bacterium]|nr:TonB-dependent receptor [Thermoanaerobaculia bacterium]
MRKLFVLVSMVVLAVGAALPALAQGTGSIEGRIVRQGGTPLGGVTVAIVGLDRAELTGADGRFVFDGVPAGTHTVTFTLGDQSEAVEEVVVAAGETAVVEPEVDWAISYVDTITVYSASRQTERITEAPAAITVISEDQIEREGNSGQVPKLLEFTPGAEVTQSGLYDFNFNARGFNSSLNRRILTLIDGRDPSVPFLGSQEWSAVSFPLDDLASLELVRGPGSALYGADAFNGVLNMVTKAPRFSRGGKVQATGGDLDTQRLDFRAAGELGGGFFGKATGGWMQSEDFSVSRNPASGGPEYRPCGTFPPGSCLEPEPVPLAVDEDELGFGGVRLDKYFGAGGHVLTLEGGTAQIEGPVAQTGIGRVQLLDVERPWARVNLNAPHWNVLGYWNSREALEQLSLRAGSNLALDSENWQFEVQGNAGFANGRGRVVGGASYKEEDIDSADPARGGIQTLMFAPVSEDFTGVFGQAEYSFTDALKAVVALRWDDSSLHDEQWSPRGSLVYAFNPNHTVRATYAEAFQTPNYSEFFLRAPVAPPLTALAALEAGLAPFLGGVPLGFGSIPILAVGNPTLEPEEVTSYELGYSGVFARRAYFTADYYRNDIENFVTDLISRIQPGIGNINPVFGPYAPPGVLPAQVQQIILSRLQQLLGPTFFVMSNAPDGSPIIVPVSYVNFGEVESEGIELGLNYYLTDNWLIDATYSWLDFEVQQELPADPVVPNAPENKAAFGLSYLAQRWDASVKFRWVDDFEWAAGVFRGPVPSYEVVNLTANWHVTDRVTVGVDVSNLLDDEHWEAFGGDILERRALGHVSFNW